MPPKRILPSALGLKKKKKREKKKKKGETKTTVQTKASEEEAGAAAAVDSSRTVVLPHINNSSRCESQSIPSVPAEVHAEVKSLLARSKFEGSALRFALNAMRQENDKLKSALSILKEKYVQGWACGAIFTLFYSFFLHEPLIQLPSAHRSFRSFKGTLPRTRLGKPYFKAVRLLHCVSVAHQPWHHPHLSAVSHY